MKKVVYVCVDDVRFRNHICHAFSEEEDAQNWCLEQYRNRYGEDWVKLVDEYGTEKYGTENGFIGYLTSGNAWPYTYYDVDCN